MTREEQIWDEACRRYADSKMRNAFVAAANWADSHPNWIPVEERLPEETQVVLALRNGFDNVDMYKYMAKDQWEWHPYYRAVVDDVTHWMPLPQPPRKEE